MDIVQFGRVISQGIGNNWVSRSAFRKGDDKSGSVASFFGRRWPTSSCRDSVIVPHAVTPCTGDWTVRTLISQANQALRASGTHLFLRSASVILSFSEQLSSISNVAGSARQVLKYKNQDDWSRSSRSSLLWGEDGHGSRHITGAESWTTTVGAGEEWRRYPGPVALLFQLDPELSYTELLGGEERASHSVGIWEGTPSALIILQPCTTCQLGIGAWEPSGNFSLLGEGVIRIGVGTVSRSMLKRFNAEADKEWPTIKDVAPLSLAFQAGTERAETTLANPTYLMLLGDRFIGGRSEAWPMTVLLCMGSAF